ncbi:PDZ domain-containing protein [Bacillus sp. CGMCC 1.16607]|uniref:PDZ domain-containing protein n=1 Tax=Bacillus sp. CGMCC 1.16607 TaxID=3351842 RepID=UPI003643ED15
MVQDWLWELLRGTGKLFGNPLFYYLFFLAGVLGVLRVKRERRNFHIRIQDAYFELRQLLPLGIVLGLVTSIIGIAAGLVIPLGAVLLFTLFTFLWSVTTKVRLISPVYIVGATFFAMIFAAGQTLPIPLFSKTFTSLDEKIYPAIGILLALLLIVEGILIIRNGSVATSPKLVKSKRGQWVGIHEAKRLWAVPLFLLIPEGTLSLPFDWWPMFSIGGDNYSLLLVPFAIGFHQQVQAQLPKEAIQLLGKRVTTLGVFTLLLATIGYWIPVATIIVVALAMIGRETLTLRQRLSEESMPFYFSKKNQGVMILGILPDSPAHKMALQVGELITKVNGTVVYNESEFYEALQRNRAHCKLEVIDVYGQIRFVQRALYEGEHHELGVLFVVDENKWETEVV